MAMVCGMGPTPQQITQLNENEEYVFSMTTCFLIASQDGGQAPLGSRIFYLRQIAARRKPLE